MQINIYNKTYEAYFSSSQFHIDLEQGLSLLQRTDRIFFVGNGGSNAICSHMMEDYAKIGRFKTQTFSDPALITCYSNDYGYENAMYEWLKLNADSHDLLVAISSSGNSNNILGAVHAAKEKGMNVISLSGFKPDNKLRGLGHVNFFLEIENYGVVECFHQVILHAMLDEYAALKHRGQD